MEEQEDKQDSGRLESIVKVSILVWSAALLSLSYYEPPSGKKIVDFDPTFIASIFSGSLAALGVQTGKNGRNNGNKEKLIVNKKDTRAGIK
tara:strand:+ start:43 stop:315 length:273 start_codon:yes stop_codon:yes gene_type:complete